MPALNEEKNIIPAIEDTLSAFEEFDVKGEILVINDGSSDSTPVLTKRKIDELPEIIKTINHPKPQGIGASFWDGVDNARGEIVCMLPGDNENDPREIIRYINLLKEVDMVIPFVFNKTVRSRWRMFLSFIYRLIINSTFSISLNYTNGTVLYRKSLLKELNARCSGFFFQTDILVRLIKRGYLYAEVPYRLRGRDKGESKAVSLSSLKAVAKGYMNLFIDIYLKKCTKAGMFALDSVTRKRYDE